MLCRSSSLLELPLPVNLPTKRRLSLLPFFLGVGSSASVLSSTSLLYGEEEEEPRLSLPALLTFMEALGFSGGVVGLGLLALDVAGLSGGVVGLGLIALALDVAGLSGGVVLLGLSLLLLLLLPLISDALSVTAAGGGVFLSLKLGLPGELLRINLVLVAFGLSGGVPIMS